MKERFFDPAAAANDRPGAVNAIGTGDIMLYGRGPEWMQVLGAPYSCPTVFSLTMPKGPVWVSRRRPGVNSWVHESGCGRLTDCASRAHGCLARRWELTEPVEFIMEAHASDIIDESGALPGFDGAWLMNVSGKEPLYNDYPLTTHTYMLAAVRGGFAQEKCGCGIRLTFCGSGDMLVVGAKSYPEAVAQLRALEKVSFDGILAAGDAEDREFLARCAARRGILKAHPLTGEVEAAIEDTALQIRAQQHTGGGVQAGHNYHLAYVRDQYGVARGLLAMGAWEEAQKIMEFYRGVFTRHGMIANAQAMGVDGIFHVHENDEVEITGYLLFQACDLMEYTGDAEFFRTLKPMLDWALQAQLKHLHNGMLPFNGDETYVAGGLLPRTCLNHGSFEATLLLIGGGRRYMDMCAELGIYEDRMDGARMVIDAAAAAFEENFRRGDVYITNSLKRLEGLTEPEFRHGVCLGGDAFDWLMRVDEGIYMCPRCAGKKSVPVFREEISLKSTLLMEPFLRAGHIDMDYVAAQTREFLAGYARTRSLPSRPDGDISLGYDFGLMLFAAKAAGLDADALLADMLAIRDECGAWAEYYKGLTPQGTRCRPWESAINIAGALKYLDV